MMILMTMPPGGYGAMRIAWWSASLASCKATRCRHWVSAHAVPPRRPPWSLILNETKKTLTKHNFYLDSHSRPTQKKLSDLKTRQGPITHILSATSPDPNPYTTSQVKDLIYILSYQT